VKPEKAKDEDSGNSTVPASDQKSKLP